ncbi:App1 family protein [Pengzhenrongella frigida]|uniref:DUF2183 domain-containing protein n=1 Tax=Pengzhenrongella frigida TaxID=1259133 RepID=A0A4Q5MYD9_9MICO|nr:phosphatase domain-containing protein [Cellulomonas sp. HLT2-17]RYV50718.1 DUF2183 domain-containing protein [Cellulomonas sp. HLT2-17]
MGARQLSAILHAPTWVGRLVRVTNSPPRPDAGGAARSMGRHRGGRIEDAMNRVVARVLWRRGWRTTVLPYAGYGGQGWIRVLARAALVPAAPPGPARGGAADPVDLPPDAVPRIRGWRHLVTAQVEGVAVEVRAGSSSHRTVSDHGGYLDVTLPVDLAPGWHQVELTYAGGRVSAPVYVVAPDVTAGIVSDIDDTVMITSAPRPLLAVWNTFVVHEGTRRPVPGMADLYGDLLRDHPGAPVIYLSTGAWNAAPALVRFLRRFDYPAGPLLLTDWGPTRTGWFRDGFDHKRAALRRLTTEFPHIRWILVGDDGQRDPEIYAELALEQPDRVRAIAIRQLSGAEQVIVHGSPAKPTAGHVALRLAAAAGVPVIAARNGARLAEGLREADIDLT